jgi:hypothetical protein
MAYQVIDTDNDTVLIDRVDGSYEDAVRAALERCDTGDLTMDEAVAEYLVSPNASEAYGVSIREVEIAASGIGYVLVDAGQYALMTTSQRQVEPGVRYDTPDQAEAAARKAAAERRVKYVGEIR